MTFLASAKSFRTVALSDQKSSAQTSRLMRFFFWIILLILLATPVILAEVYLRSIGIGDPILYYADTAYRFAPRPNQRHVGQRGAAVTLDSKGLRGAGKTNPIWNL